MRSSLPPPSWTLTSLLAGWLELLFFFHGGAAGGAILSSAELRGKKKAELYLKFPNFGPPELLPLFPPRSAPPLSLRRLVVVFHFDLRFLLVTMERKKVFDDIYFKLYRCSK